MTDPSSRILKGRRGYHQGYNGQAAVSGDQIVVAAGVCDRANDMKQLAPMLEEIDEELEAAGLKARDIAHVLADSGYWSTQSVTEAQQYLDVNGLEAKLLVPPPKQRRTLKEAPPDDTPPPADLSVVKRLEHQAAAPAGREAQKRRAQTVEPVFGQIKSARGLARLRLRGMELANGEWRLMCLTHNLLKLWRSGAALLRGAGLPRLALA